jgi:adiponectin receptor
MSRHSHCCGIPYYPELEDIRPENGFKTPLHQLLNNDQPYIYSGYRKMPINNISKTICSVFFLHNETMNILTHSLPLIAWGFLYYEILANPSPNMSSLDFWVMMLYLVCTTIMFVMSSGYHLMRANSESFYHFFLCCDLRGIILLLFGCNVMTLNFELSCHPMERNIGIIFNTILAIALCLWIPTMVKFRLTKKRTIYFALFSMLGGVGWAYRFLFIGNINWVTFWPMFYSYTSAMIALVVKELKLPEKQYPYRFDLLVGINYSF